MTVNGAVISGVPAPLPLATPTQTFNVKITATGPTDTQTVTLRITIYTRARIEGWQVPKNLVVNGIVGVPWDNLGPPDSPVYPVLADGSPEKMQINVGALPPNLVFDQTVTPPVIKGTPVRAGTFDVNLTVTNIATAKYVDGTPRYDVGAKVTLVVNIAQMQITGPNPLRWFGTVGVPLTPCQITATGNPTSFSASGLPQGISIDTAAGLIYGFPVMAGTYPVTIGAHNGTGNASSTLYLIIDSATGAPAILDPLVKTDFLGDPMSFDYQIVGTNNPTSYSVVAVDPNTPLSLLGLQLITNPNDPQFPNLFGHIIGTPSMAGSFEYTISASNASGTGSATLLIAISSTQNAPAITSPLHEQALAGANFQYQIAASNNPTSFNASVGGNTLGSLGLSIDQGTGQISGAPYPAGQYDITLTASNQAGTGLAILHLDVLTAHKPVITSLPNTAGVVGVPFWYVITADFTSSGANGETPYGANNLPPGLTVNGSSGLIYSIKYPNGNSGPLLAGTYVGDPNGITGPSMSATNQYGTTTEGLTITILPAPGAPVITSPPLAAGITSQTLSYQITATNSPTSYSEYTFALPPGVDPATVNVSVDGTTGVLSFSSPSAGTYQYIVGASNSAGLGTAVLTITISSPVPAITSAQVTNGAVGVPFNFTLQASGQAPIAFQSTPLPAGLFLVGTTIVGVPTVAGSFTVNITATNTFGSNTQPLTIIIAPPTPPTITSTLSIQGMAGVALPPYQVTATGSLPITYSATNLPTGLVFANGILSGTPTTAGSYVITLTASNSAGTNTQTLVLNVNPVVIGQDVSGNGFPAELLIFLGLNPLDPNSTPFDGLPGAPEPFNMQPKLNVKLNFAKPIGNDKITLSGTLPMPAGFGAPGETVVLDIGGVLAKATLDRKGSFVSPNKSINFKLSAKSGRLGQNAKYTFTLNGSFQSQLAASGLTNQTVKAGRVHVNVIILLINAQLMFQETDTLVYTAKLNKTGTAK